MKQKDYMAAAPHSAAIEVTGSSKVFWALVWLFEGQLIVFFSLRAPTLLILLCLTGFQLQHRVQQHHSSFPTHGRQYPEQRPPQRSKRDGADPNLDQTVRLRESSAQSTTTFIVCGLKSWLPEPFDSAANPGCNVVRSGVRWGYHAGNAGCRNAGLFCNGSHPRSWGNHSHPAVMI